MINLDYQGRTPIYEQIILEIEKYVSLGILKPKDQLMSIREMATTLGINPNTVKKAYTELENKGVITVISTKRAYITENIKGVVDKKVNSKINEINNIIEELEKLGITKPEVINKIK